MTIPARSTPDTFPRAKAVQRSIDLLMQAHPKAATPEDAIRRAARDLVSFARDLGWQGPPFDPQIAASLRGIHATPSSTIEQDALIRPTPCGTAFEIVWNEKAHRARVNFSFCHEISHTFFPDCAEAIRYRSVGHRCDPGRPLERLCDIGASEILLPFDSFSEDARTLGLSIHSVVKLRTQYQASREAVARRLVELNVQPCAAVFLTHRLSLKERRAAGQTMLFPTERPRPKLRVDMMTASASFGPTRMPVHKSIPDGSCAYDALNAPDHVLSIFEGEERWPAGSGTLPPCHVQTMAIPPNGSGEARVLALLVPMER